MEREDSGVIDLFALNSRARAAAAASPPASVPRDLFSAPPPAYTTDLCGEPSEHELGSNHDTGENPFAVDPKQRKKKLMMIGGGAAALLAFIVIIRLLGQLDARAPEGRSRRCSPGPAAAARDDRGSRGHGAAGCRERARTADDRRDERNEAAARESRPCSRRPEVARDRRRREAHEGPERGRRELSVARRHGM